MKTKIRNFTIGTNYRKTTEEFILQMKLLNDEYDYSKVDYINNQTKVCIICPKHGEFWQTPSNHLKGQGCPKCGKIKNGVGKKLFHLKSRDWNFEQPEEYKLIPLTQGKFAKVDNEDFDRLKDINWSYSDGYAINHKLGSMHRYIMNAPSNMLVDHKKLENTLDNRKENLRLATKSQNASNIKSHVDSTSQYKGVSWRKDTEKWNASITKDGVYYSLGCYSTEEEAALAYDKKALELFGEFARLNFKYEKE